MPHGESVGPLFGRYLSTVMTIQGRPFYITHILSEQLERNSNEYWFVFEASYEDDPQPVIVKARVQLSNEGMNADSAATARRVAEECYHDEADALQSCLEIQPCAFPSHITQDEITQGPGDPFPGGYIRAIAMSKVPGECVVDILDALTPEDRSIIRSQLARTLEQIRLKGFTFDDEETEQSFYDTTARKMYIISFSRIGRELGPPREEDKITESSVYVTAFGMGLIGR